ncbi:MAG: SDR family NAD(P)-dependent oxidoreductase [Halieaceae bacterium]|nr:SDR family NAD(P)-dependent oxidoreductase [Halieaceae bacterium]
MTDPRLTAIVTGAASGIGRAIALLAAERGYIVVAVDKNQQGLDSLEPVLKAYNTDAFCKTVDVSNTQQMAALADEVFTHFQQVNLLFNNAGMVVNQPVLAQSAQTWQTVVNVNLMGVVNGLLAFVPRIIEQGSHAHIVNTGSVASFISGPGLGSYTATKMAVRGITETLQQELAAQGADIGVSILCPGPVDTPILTDSGLIADNLQNGPIEDAGKTEDPDLMEAISPRRCAEIVFRGIEARDFAIFTHPSYKPVCQALINSTLGLE